jgi:hypothetical protein
MGVSDVNAGFNRYHEDGTVYIGPWAGQGSVPVHKCAPLGVFGDTAATAKWQACVDAATSSAAFYAELDVQDSAAYTEVMTWSGNARDGVYKSASHARINGLGP